MTKITFPAPPDCYGELKAGDLLRVNTGTKDHDLYVLAFYNGDPFNRQWRTVNIVSGGTWNGGQPDPKSATNGMKIVDVYRNGKLTVTK